MGRPWGHTASGTAQLAACHDTAPLDILFAPLHSAVFAVAPAVGPLTGLLSCPRSARAKASPRVTNTAAYSSKSRSKRPTSPERLNVSHLAADIEAVASGAGRHAQALNPTTQSQPFRNSRLCGPRLVSWPVSLTPLLAVPRSAGSTTDLMPLVAWTRSRNSQVSLRASGAGQARPRASWRRRTR